MDNRETLLSLVRKYSANQRKKAQLALPMSPPPPLKIVVTTGVVDVPPDPFRWQPDLRTLCQNYSVNLHSPDKQLTWDVKLSMDTQNKNLKAEMKAVMAANPCDPVVVAAMGSIHLQHANGCSCVSRSLCGGCKFAEFTLTVSSTFELTINTGTAFCVFRLAKLSLTHFPELPYGAHVMGNDSTISVPCLKSSMQALLDSGRLADVTFEVGGTAVLAHRQILAARSDVFAAMFEHDTLDKRTGRVTIADADPTSFKEMLRCLYTDDVPKWTEEDDREALLMGLLMLSEKYCLQRLKAQCSRRLLGTMTVGNTCERLKRVNVICHELVEPIASGFVKANLMKILRTAEWRKLMRADGHLAADVMEHAIPAGESELL